MLDIWVSDLNPQQEKAVADFLSGRDVFVNLPTGNGKPKALNISYGSTRQWRLNFQSSTAIFQTKA